MSIYTLIVIIGTLMIIGGISLAATPLMTFVTAGYFIIILFFVAGIIGIIRAVHEKRYDRSFIFSILSLVLGMAGLVTPGAAAMNNFTLLYMAATWLFVHGVMTIIAAVDSKDKGAGKIQVIFGVVIGVLELIMCILSVIYPMMLAFSLGILVGFYFIESGANMIFVGSNISKAAAIARVANEAESSINK